MRPADLEAYLREQIPLAAAMSVRVLEAGPERVCLEAPLEPNLNHRATAFGGSVAALAVLAGWSLVHVRLDAEGRATRTVIQESSVRYDAPVHAAFVAVCDAPPPDAWRRFLRALDRYGKGRIKVEARVQSEGADVGTFAGRYVSLAGSEAAG